MIRRLRPEETRLWSLVTSTVSPSRPPARPEPAAETPEKAAAPMAAPRATPVQVGRLKGLKLGGGAPPTRLVVSAPKGPEPIEPGRRRRIARVAGELARLDLHGLNQDQARALLEDFLIRAQARGARSALVITGKGPGGEGVLRRRVPDWLAAPALRGVVAGVSPAHRRHGGEGALYVAIKARPEDRD